jgi:hypothetical protein
MTRYRRCRNPLCEDSLYTPVLFCPSCWWMGRRMFASGAFVAGLVWTAVAWWLR